MRPDVYKQARSRAYQARLRSKGGVPQNSNGKTSSDQKPPNYQQKIQLKSVDENKETFCVSTIEFDEQEDDDGSLFDIETTEQLESLLSDIKCCPSSYSNSLEKSKIQNSTIYTSEMTREIICKVLIEDGSLCDEEIRELPERFINFLRSSEKFIIKKIDSKSEMSSLSGLLSNLSTREDCINVTVDPHPLIPDENDAWLDTVL